MILEQMIAKLSNDELKEAFIEITDWRKSGTLKDGIIRKTHEKFIEHQASFPIFAMEFAFEYEMAKRWYKLSEDQCHICEYCMVYQKEESKC